MTRRERVIAALEHREADKVPYQMDFTQQEYDKVAQYLGDPHFGKRIQNHIVSAYYDGYLTEIRPGSGYWRDDFGVVWNRNGADKDIGVIDGLVLPEPSLKDYRFPELDEARLRADYEAAVATARAEGRFLFGSIGFSLFERAWTLRGMANLLMDMVAEPAFVDELLDRITDYNLRIMDIALEYPLDGFHFGDDWGQQRGLIMGPRHWRRFIKPRLARMYGRAREKGLYVSQHSCGDIHEVFPDLIEIGLNVYQTFQPEIYDIAAVKAEYGKDLAFWGGISTQTLLPFATPEGVRQKVLETLTILAPGGGYILAPTHALPGDIPAENIVALMDVFEKQR